MRAGSSFRLHAGSPGAQAPAGQDTPPHADPLAVPGCAAAHHQQPAARCCARPGAEHPHSCHAGGSHPHQPGPPCCSMVSHLDQPFFSNVPRQSSSSAFPTLPSQSSSLQPNTHLPHFWLLPERTLPSEEDAGRQLHCLAVSNTCDASQRSAAFTLLWARTLR